MRFSHGGRAGVILAIMGTSSDAMRTLLLVLVQNALLLVATVVVFWAGVFVLNRLGFGRGYGLLPLGFARPEGGFPAGIGLGVLVGAGAILVSFPVNLLSVWVLELAGRPVDSTSQEPLMRGIEAWISESPLTAIVASFLIVGLIGPAVEELFFRGVLFNGLYRLGKAVGGRVLSDETSRKAAEWVTLVLSVVVTSAFFASLHLDPAIFLAIFILAVSLCVLYVRTGSLIPSIVAHATFNSFTVAILALSGLGVFPTSV